MSIYKYWINPTLRTLHDIVLNVSEIVLFELYWERKENEVTEDE